jgi:hypothetical protein
MLVHALKILANGGIIFDQISYMDSSPSRDGKGAADTVFATFEEQQLEGVL